MKRLLHNEFVRVGVVAVLATMAFILGMVQRELGDDVSVVDVFRQVVGGNESHGNLPAIPRPIPPEQAGRIAAMHATHKRNSELATLLQGDPQAGLAELAKLSPGPDTLATYGWVFSRWATWSGQEAATTAYNLPAGPERTAALTELLLAWTQQEPQAVLQWAINLPASDAATIKTALSEVSRQNPKTAAQYIDTIKDVTARNQAISAIAVQMAKNEPETTLDWLEQVATGATYDNSVKKLMVNLSLRAPARAAQLVEKINESGLREEVMAIIAKNWTKLEPPAAAAWINNLPPGAGRDAAWQAANPKN